MDGASFITGFFIGALGMFFLLAGIAQSGIFDESDELNAFIKVCPQYDVGFYNDKYKLSCDKGMIKLTPYRYSKLTEKLN
ncbi:hypothetical protein AB7340_17705 [Providencia alcalifaciens]|uniref:hypothetical protein n=1 Tax=Providencia TaxID=586 RepID=UPI001E3C983D|nr:MULTISPECIES: hypothetical protein [Providencia]UEK61604.1 hypothetical protein LL668_20975 [Providencia rettgeri]